MFPSLSLFPGKVPFRDFGEKVVLDTDMVRLKSPRFAAFDSNCVSLGEKEVYLLVGNFVTLAGRLFG